MNDRVYVGSLISEPHIYHHGILGMRLEYGRTVNKKTGELGFITFEDYVDAVDDNQISKID